MRPFITAYGSKFPRIHDRAYVDISARIIGDVTIDEKASVWPGAVLRADSAGIHVARRSAILDLALLEAPENHPVLIEEDVVISHGAIIHGAAIHSNALVGIGAIVLDAVVVSSGSIVGAASLVTAGTTIPPNSLVLGAPAKVVRETTPKERKAIFSQLEELQQKVKQLSDDGP